MDNKGYYKLLGVAEDASADEIQKKFRSLALKWHPDRWANGTEQEKKTAEEKFKEYNEAYGVLSDPEKRRAYDTGFDTQPGGTPDEDPLASFAQRFWGNNNPFAGRQEQQVVRGNDIDVTLNITMEEANNGIFQKEIHYNIHKKCSHCNGTGLGEHGRIDTCPHCNGTGFMTHYERHGFMEMRTQTICPHCHGVGKTVINPCTHCGGTGFDKMPTTETVVIDIPQGVIFNGGVRVNGLGEYPERGEGIRGDLVIHTNLVLPDGYSVMDNRGGILYKLDVPFYDAFLGCVKEVTMPSGKKLKITLNEGTKSGDERIYHNEGMRLPNGTSVSNFKVVFNFTSGTKKLTKEQKELLSKLKESIEKK